MRTSVNVGELQVRLFHDEPGENRLVSDHSKHVAAQQGNSESMLYTIATVLIAIWLLGMVSSYTMGGFVHVLIVAAVVLVLVRLISGRRVAA